MIEPAITVVSPLHWIIYVVNNNLKKSCVLHLWEIHNSIQLIWAFHDWKISHSCWKRFVSRRRIPQFSIKLT